MKEIRKRWKRESDRVGDLNDPTGIRQKFVTDFYWDFVRYLCFSYWHTTPRDTETDLDELR